jgi:GxxExxY protein
MRTGTVSVLTPEHDELISRVIGRAIRVHKELGPGFLERIYATALAFELEEEGIPFERERSVVVNYRDVLPISGQRIDFVVADSVILEIKAVSRIEPIFEAKMISYLRTTKIKVGLIMNFNVLLLKDGIRRIVV